jgi:hypothetical protein
MDKPLDGHDTTQIEKARMPVRAFSYNSNVFMRGYARRSRNVKIQVRRCQVKQSIPKSLNLHLLCRKQKIVSAFAS